MLPRGDSMETRAANSTYEGDFLQSGRGWGGGLCSYIRAIFKAVKVFQWIGSVERREREIYRERSWREGGGEKKKPSLDSRAQQEIQ